MIFTDNFTLDNESINYPILEIVIFLPAKISLFPKVPELHQF